LISGAGEEGYQPVVPAHISVGLTLRLEPGVAQQEADGASSAK
jgi:hypothetical protein